MTGEQICGLRLCENKATFALILPSAGRFRAIGLNLRARILRPTRATRATRATLPVEHYILNIPNEYFTFFTEFSPYYSCEGKRLLTSNERTKNYIARLACLSSSFLFCPAVRFSPSKINEIFPMRFYPPCDCPSELSSNGPSPAHLHRSFASISNTFNLSAAGYRHPEMHDWKSVQQGVLF